MAEPGCTNAVSIAGSGMVTNTWQELRNKSNANGGRNMDAATLILRKETYIGGELEVQAMEDGIPYQIMRGPITDIKAVGFDLVFEFKWLARMQPGTATWTLADNEPIKLCALSVNFGEIGGNRLFSTLRDGVVTVFPKDGSKLFPERVHPNPEAV
jgi:hypothetical protein